MENSSIVDVLLSKGSIDSPVVFVMCGELPSPNEMFGVSGDNVKVVASLGGVLDDVGLASISFWVREGAKAIVVIGHSECKAFSLANETILPDSAVQRFVEKIKPSLYVSKDEPVKVLLSYIVDDIRLRLPSIKKAEEGKLEIVKLMYSNKEVVRVE